MAALFILVLLAVPVAILLLWYRQLCFGRQVVVKGRRSTCVACKYPLEGLAESGPCPECGTEFGPEQISDYRWTYSVASTQFLLAVVLMLSAMLGPIPERIVSIAAYLGPGRNRCVDPWFDTMMIESTDKGHASPWPPAILCLAIGLPFARVASSRQTALMIGLPLLGMIAAQGGVAFSDSGWNQGVFVGFRESSPRGWLGFAAAWLIMLTLYGRQWIGAIAQQLAKPVIQTYETSGETRLSS